MKPIWPEPDYGEQISLGNKQPEYLNLPCCIAQSTGAVTTKWHLTDEERLAIAQGADVYLETQTYFKSFQPVFLWVEGMNND